MTANKSYILSDLAKVDAYRLGESDYEEIPEATATDFARATVNEGGQPMRGRPTLGDKAKRQVTLRVDSAVLAHFRATGAGWQSRMNEWLAARQEVAGVIASYEYTANEMRQLLAQLKDSNGSAPALKPGQMKSIENVEMQIAVTEKAAANVRKMLRDQALHTPGS